MHRFVYQQETYLPRKVDEVFSFFANAENLEAITPPWLHFSILTPTPIQMAAGTLIDYRLRVRGMPIRWQTEITRWNPPHDFVDEQRRGPYHLWVHQHTFTPDGSGTRMQDHVTYAVPGGKIIERLFVRNDIARIFNYRQKVILSKFPITPDPVVTA